MFDPIIRFVLMTSYGIRDKAASVATRRAPPPSSTA